MKHNRLTLTATLQHKEPLRYSPAGVPILQMRIAHESEQIEAGHPRRVTCEIPAVAVGDVAARLATESIETEWRFSGFIANKRRYEIAELHVVEQAPCVGKGRPQILRVDGGNIPVLLAINHRRAHLSDGLP